MQHTNRTNPICVASSKVAIEGTSTVAVAGVFAAIFVVNFANVNKALIIYFLLSWRLFFFVPTHFLAAFCKKLVLVGQ